MIEAVIKYGPPIVVVVGIFVFAGGWTWFVSGLNERLNGPKHDDR